ncbi:MAG TPA: hydroxymethylbilane synthase, partial [Actinomycetota bacterium]|nr:hydroxymethylbilane synthase [Actinomycetota bacterium]
DKSMRAALAQLDDADSRRAFEAERSFALSLDEQFEIPIGALAESSGELVRCRGLVAGLDGRRVLTEQIEGDDPEKVGIQLADRLRALGADELLRM